MFDAVALLGICDKIVPGLLIGALRFGHLPMLLVPGGPMPSGLPNKEKQRIRQLFAEGKVGKDELLKAESRSYHAPGTCTFYGTANSNQMMMELMGLHIPNAAFINPGTPLRQALTRAAVHRLADLAREWRAAAGRGRRRESDRQRDGRPARDGRIDEPFHSSAGDRARGGDPHRLAGLRRAFVCGPARRARLSKRREGRERLPGRGRHGVRHLHAGREGLIHTDN